MAKRKPKTGPSETVSRVAAILLDCPLTADEVRLLEKIETRRQDAERDQRVALTDEQRTRAYDKAAKAGDEALALMEKVKARSEAEWSAKALREAEQLAKLRGEDTETTQSGCRLRVSPLTRLYRGRLIAEDEYDAGKLYGATWQRLYGGRNGNGTGCGDLDPLETRIADLKRLDEARGYAIAEVGGRKVVGSGLGGDARLISICDAVCGEERSLREVVLGRASGEIVARKAEGESDAQAKVRVSGHRRKVTMERLKYALGLLALHYGLRRTREDELRAA